jgi:hypothetical protein
MKITPFVKLTVAVMVMAIIALTVSIADAGKRNRCDRNGCRKNKHITVYNKKPIKVAVECKEPYQRYEVKDISNSKRGEARFQIPRGYCLTTQFVSAHIVPQGNQVKRYRIHRLRLEAASRRRQTFGCSDAIDPYEYGDPIFSPLTLHARRNVQAFVFLGSRSDKNTTFNEKIRNQYKDA